MLICQAFFKNLLHFETLLTNSILILTENIPVPNKILLYLYWFVNSIFCSIALYYHLTLKAMLYVNNLFQNSCFEYILNLFPFLLIAFFTCINPSFLCKFWLAIFSSLIPAVNSLKPTRFAKSYASIKLL